MEKEVSRDETREREIKGINQRKTVEAIVMNRKGRHWRERWRESSDDW